VRIAERDTCARVHEARQTPSTSTSAAIVRDMSPRSQVRRFYDQVWNVPDVSAIPSVMHPEVLFRGSLGVERVGHAEFADYVRSVTTSLASYRCNVLELVVEGDSAVARMEFSGVQVGELLGCGPTGQRVSWAGAAFFRFEHDLIRRLWVLGDLDSLHAQLTSRDAP
jgi:predicted ester cyclase